MNVPRCVALGAIAYIVVAGGYRIARAQSSSSASGQAVPTPASMAACNQQPNMASALDKLKEARGWLDQAEHNKGGWNH